MAQSHDLTIVLAEDSAAGESIREVLAGWTLDGLLRRSFWVRPGGVHPGTDSAPAWISAVALDPAGAIPSPRAAGVPGAAGVAGGPCRARVGEVDLQDAIRGVRYRLVRLVLLQPVSRGGQPQPEVRTAAVELLTLLKGILPADVRIVTVNLVVPETGITDVDPAVLMAGWEVNAIASPEDRASAAHPDIFVDAETLPGHAALHCATVGGLWADVAEGPYDVRSDATPGEPAPVVVRAYVRSIVNSDLVPAVAQEGLSPRAGRWPVPTSEAERLVPTAQPQRLVETTFEELGTAHGAVFRFRPAAWEAPPSPQQVGIGQALKLFFNFLVALVKRVPSWVEERARDAANTMVANATFGSGGLIEVGRRARQRAADAREIPQAPASDAFGARVPSPPEGDAGGSGGEARPGGRADEGDRLAREALASLQQPVLAIETPEVWRDLRQVTLGLQDGGPMPAGFSTPRLGSAREVIVEPGAIGPHPHDRYRPDPQVLGKLPALRDAEGMKDIRACDPRAAKQFAAALRPAVGEGREEVRRLQRQVHDLRARHAAATGQLEVKQAVVQALPEPDQAVLAEVATLRAEVASLQAKITATEADLRLAQERLGRLEAELERFDAWIARRSGTLLWRTADAVYGEEANAYDSLQRSLSVVAEGVSLDLSEVQTARRRLVNTWLWSLVGTGVAVALGVAHMIFGFFGIAPGWGLALVSTALLALPVIYYRSFRRYVQTVNQAQYRVALSAHTFGQAVAAARQAAAEHTRLWAMYLQMRDWAEIQGWVLHRPWTPEPAPDATDAAKTAQPVREADPRVPTAYQDAVGTVGEETRSQLAARLAARVTRQGWASRVYLTSAAQGREAFNRSHGRRAEDAFGDADTDVPQAATGARADLLGGLASGAYARSATDEAVGEAVEFCAGLQPQEAFDRVQPSADDLEVTSPDVFLTELVPEAGGLLFLSPGLFDASAMPAQPHQVRRVWVRAPESVVTETLSQRRDAPGTSRDGMDIGVSSVDVSARRMLVQAVRLDETDPLDPLVLALFGVPGEDVTRPSRLDREVAGSIPVPGAEVEEDLFRF